MTTMRTALRDLAVLAAFPLLLVCFNDYWGFTSTQSAFIDPWLYVGRFLHPKAHLLAFPLGYYGDRLSHTVPGAVLYYCFGPWVGNYALKLLQIYATLFALYFLLRGLFNQRTALFSCALLSVHPYFLMAFSWDYPNGSGIAWCALALMLVFRAAQSRTYRLSLFLAGACCVSLLTAHFVWLSLAWMIPAAFYFANRAGAKHPLLPSLAMFLFGGFIAGCVYGAIYHSLSGWWFFLMNTRLFLLNMAKTGTRLVWPLGRGWVSDAHWLDQFACLFPLSVWMLTRRERRAAQTIAAGLFAGAFLTICTAQWAGFGFLNAQEYTSFLFPVYALGMGALVTDRVSAVGEGAYRGLTTAILVAGTLLIFADWYVARIAEPLGDHPFFIVAALGVPFGICLFTRSLGNARALVIFVSGMTLMFVVQLAGGTTRGWFSGTSGYSNKQGFHMIVDADRWIGQHSETRRVLVWYDGNEPRQGILVGLASLYEGGFSLLNAGLPAVAAEERWKMATKPTVVCFSWSGERLQAARAALGSMTAWDETAIGSGELELHLGIARMRP